MAVIKLPPWRKDQLDLKYQRQNMVINKAVVATEKVLLHAVNYIVDHGVKTGHWHPPSLNELYAINETFYRDVISQAYYACQDEKKVQRTKKRLAKAKWPTGIPKDLRGLEKLFRDKRYWPMIMKRSKKIVDRVRKKYLMLLQRRFSKILPELRAGEITKEDVRAQLMKTWEATKPRVELIFRTETTTYFGKTQVAFFNDDEEIIGFLFHSVKDIGRTAICKVRHGLIFTKKHEGELSLTRNTPALHYNCRSDLIPLANTPDNVKMLEDPQLNPENHKAEILAADRLEHKIRF